MTTALLSPGSAQAAGKSVTGKKIVVESNPSKNCSTNREIVTPRRTASCAGIGEHAEWRFTMGTFSGPHVPRVSLGISALKPGLEALARRSRSPKRRLPAESMRARCCSCRFDSGQGAFRAQDSEYVAVIALDRGSSPHGVKRRLSWLDLNFRRP
jgi:hypothetical protein